MSLPRLWSLAFASVGALFACYLVGYVLVAVFTVVQLPAGFQVAGWQWIFGAPSIGGTIPTGKAPCGLPADGRITQGFHPGHSGVDIGVEPGTPVLSTINGQVVFAGWSTVGYGNLVIVENGNVQTYYAHLSAILVVLWQNVSRGEAVGLSGSTGNSTGPHVHYEVRVGGVPVDPFLWSDPSVGCPVLPTPTYLYEGGRE